MATDVMERPELAAVITEDDDAFRSDLSDYVVSRRGKLLGPSGIKPHIQMDTLELESKEIRICVVPRRKRLGAGRHLSAGVFVHVERSSY
jgi:hypothetical protein